MIPSVAHVHTRCSFDSFVHPRLLARKLIERKIGMVIVTDHDTFQGAIEVRAWARKMGSEMLVPLAAEVCTDRGDVVVIIEQETAPRISDMKRWERLVPLVRCLGGIIWLPHPFHQHREAESMAEQADVIEVFNSRCTQGENEMAAELCLKLGKTPGYGADAHFLSECFLTVSSYPDGPDSITILRQTPFCRACELVPRWRITASQVIKAIKTRDLRNLLMNLARLCLHVIVPRNRR